jgi:dihydrofolate reductase
MASSRMTEFKMIVALCRGGGIGYKGTLPWPKIERDLRFFSQMTKSSVFPYNSAVVMGRKTWESIPANVQPLPFRDNFVVSALHDAGSSFTSSSSMSTSDHSEPPPTGVTFIKNLSEIHNHAMNYDHVWFIGGASIYEQILASPTLFPVDDIYITFVDESYEHDASFPLMYQYESVEEWQKLRNKHIHRAIWCWTDADTIPEYVSFFAEGEESNQIYRVIDVDRDLVASITRPADLKAIQERRTPNTIFLRLSRLMEV